MRAGLGLIIAAAGLACGCSWSTQRVAADDNGLVLRWNEADIGPERVWEQAQAYCSKFGFNASRATAIADDKDGTAHITRFSCRPVANGGSFGDTAGS